MSFSILGIRDDEPSPPPAKQARLDCSCALVPVCVHMQHVLLRHTLQSSAVLSLMEKVTCGSQAVEQCASATKPCGAPHGIREFSP